MQILEEYKEGLEEVRGVLEATLDEMADSSKKGWERLEREDREFEGRRRLGRLGGGDLQQ